MSFIGDATMRSCVGWIQEVLIGEFVRWRLVAVVVCQRHLWRCGQSAIEKASHEEVLHQ